MAAGLGVILAVVIATAFTVSIYNKLVTSRNQFKNAYAQIDVQLKRRHDLIPNLVETAKAFMAHEKQTLEAVIQARNFAESARQRVSQDPANPQAMQSLIQSEGQLTGTLGRLFALAESYPDLKANQNMLALQEELVSTENKVSFSRQAFNDAVTYYNNRREVFPNSLIAGMFNFQPAQLFEIDNPIEKSAPQVRF